MIKKFAISSIMSVLFVTIMTSCTFVYHQDIDRKAKTWIEYFEDEDVEGLFSIFCSDIKDNYTDKTKE